MPTWFSIQDLKIRCLDHAATYPVGGSHYEYWWDHYKKLDALQDGLKKDPWNSDDEIPF